MLTQDVMKFQAWMTFNILGFQKKREGMENAIAIQYFSTINTQNFDNEQKAYKQ